MVEACEDREVDRTAVGTVRVEARGAVAWAGSVEGEEAAGAVAEVAMAEAIGGMGAVASAEAAKVMTVVAEMIPSSFGTSKRTGMAASRTSYRGSIPILAAMLQSTWSSTQPQTWCIR